MTDHAQFEEISGVRIELVTRGAGAPLLLLHPEIGLAADAPVLDRLAERFKVLAPSHPGFGRSDLPAWVSSVDDLAFFYLDFLDAYDLRDVTVVGASLGGWIAAEMAVRSTERIARLVLAGAAGIKVAPRDARDFVDYFALSDADLAALTYAEPAKHRRDPKQMSDEELGIAFRNRESTGLFAWSPWMHDPKLARRLHRIRKPTLVVWGGDDRIVSPDYGRAYARAIPGARFELVPASGHYPHLEQPARFADLVRTFSV